MPSATERFGQATGDAPILPILMILIGAYLAWFGVKYWEDKTVIWPSDPVKNILQGKGLPAHEPVTTASIELTSAESQASQASQPASPGGQAPQGAVPSGSAQQTARVLLAKYGWGPSEMGPLILLWDRESGWNPEARNPDSGAFGIAQALGHGEADTAASDGTNEYGAEYGLSAAEARAANSGDARWQIEWGLGYIKDDPEYGSPSAAWAHEQANGWY